MLSFVDRTMIKSQSKKTASLCFSRYSLSLNANFCFYKLYQSSLTRFCFYQTALCLLAFHSPSQSTPSRSLSLLFFVSLPPSLHILLSLTHLFIHISFTAVTKREHKQVKHRLCNLLALSSSKHKWKRKIWKEIKSRLFLLQNHILLIKSKSIFN